MASNSVVHYRAYAW